MSSLMKSRSCKSSWCSSSRSCRLSFLAYPPKTNHAAKAQPASQGTIELPIERANSAPGGAPGRLLHSLRKGNDAASRISPSSSAGVELC